ncbi:MAG TPA: YtxH domain-containing protein [Chitinophagaceae bacterium]|jgi:gas vesicle protein|nr:YtxH domain-containing protein [Chitinophagaceae bacterium]
MTTKSKIILGLVGAAAAGVVVGLLLAPEKGEEIRGRIKSTAGDWADHLTDLFANAKGEITDLAGKARKGATDAASSVGNKFSNTAENFS